MVRSKTTNSSTPKTESTNEIAGITGVIPATFILDRDGTVLYASAREDYTERPEPADILLQLLHPQQSTPAS